MAATIAIGAALGLYLRWLRWRESRGIRTPQEAEAERRARLRAEQDRRWDNPSA